MQRHTARHHRDLDIRAERELRIRHEHLAVEIFAVALETWILFHFKDDEDVASWSAARSHVTDSAHRHVLTGRDSRRYADDDLLLAASAAFTSALLARRRDDAAFAGAGGARSDTYHLAEERPLRAAYFPASTARRARRRRCAWFGATTVAAVARLEQSNCDRLFRARRNFRERHLHCELDVGSRARTTAAPASSSAKQIAEAAQSTETAEVAHENVECFREIHVMEATRASTQSRFTVAIVHRALVGIAQHVVRLSDGLELLLGFGGAVVAIRVVRHRQLAIRLLDLLVARVARDAEGLVKLSHDSGDSPSTDPSQVPMRVSQI